MVINEGQASGQYSIAGGSTDASVVEDAIGISISNINDSLIES